MSNSPSRRRIQIRLRVNPCIEGRSNHRFGTDGICIYCLFRRPKYYGGPVCQRESEDRDPYAEGFTSNSPFNPYRIGTQSEELWRLGRNDAGKKIAGLTFLAILSLVLLCPRRARAGILEMDFGNHPVTVLTTAPLPDQFSYAVTGSLVQLANSATVMGGAYFPDGTDHGWTLLPAIPQSNVTPFPWAFEVLPSNPAVWQIDLQGNASSSWNVVGEVESGFDFLDSLADGPHTSMYGLQNLPVNAAGAAYVLTDIQQVPVGFPVFVPEPMTAAGLLGLGVALFRRNRRCTPRHEKRAGA